jgi:hypothetical protein
MIYTMPLRRTMRHLEQRLRMEGETFMIQLLACGCFMTAKVLIILAILAFVYIFTVAFSCFRSSQDSQDEGFTFGDGNCMFEMRRQRTISRDNRPLIRQDAGFVRPN